MASDSNEPYNYSMLERTLGDLRLLAIEPYNYSMLGILGDLRLLHHCNLMSAERKRDELTEAAVSVTPATHGPAAEACQEAEISRCDPALSHELLAHVGLPPALVMTAQRYQHSHHPAKQTGVESTALSTLPPPCKTDW